MADDLEHDDQTRTEGSSDLSVTATAEQASAESSDDSADIPEDLPDAVSPQSALRGAGDAQEIAEDTEADELEPEGTVAEHSGERQDVLPNEHPEIREDIRDDPEFVDEYGDPKWPSHDGFVGEPETVSLRPHEVIDRYGPDDGFYASPLGTFFEERSLPWDEESTEYQAYEVATLIEAREGDVAPWFNEPGGGRQIMFDTPIQSLVADGSLRRKI